MADVPLDGARGCVRQAKVVARGRISIVHLDAELPSTRIRILQLIPYLRARGFEIELHRYGEWAWLDRPRDVVVLQKKLPSFFDARRFAKVSEPLVFDFDDAVMFRHRERNGSYVSKTRRRRFDRITKIANAFVCGNDYLEAQLPADADTVVIPSPVPHEVPRRVHEETPTLRVAWVGLSQNLRFLRALEGVWPALEARGIAVRLVVVSNETFETTCAVDYVPWSIDAQHDTLATCDVGIMPLALDSPWTRGKCAYKALQYMAAELPVVASDVGMNRDVIDDGVEGHLATDTSSWVDKFVSLASADVRRRMGAAGRRRIEATMTYDVIADRWTALLDRLAGTEFAAVPSS